MFVGLKHHLDMPRAVMPLYPQADLRIFFAVRNHLRALHCSMAFPKAANMHCFQQICFSLRIAAPKYRQPVSQGELQLLIIAKIFQHKL